MESIREIIRRNLNTLVDSSDKTKRAIARSAGVSEATLQRWKTGDSTPELKNIEGIAEVLGIDPTDIYRSDGPRVFPRKGIHSLVAAIPEEVYDLAARVGADSKVWTNVQKLLEIEISSLEREQKKKTRQA